MSLKNSRKFAVGAILAGFIGYIAGILTAPKSGKETREEVVDTAVEVKRQIEKELKIVHSETKTYIAKAEKMLEKKGMVAKKEVQELATTAKKSEKKIKELLSAIHDGSAENKELQDALTEAKKIRDSLKKYFTDK
jgi:gas vesicle protein